jgi:hypothetical protein
MAMPRALASILLLVSTAVLTDAARACSCARNPTAERILEGAAAVFTGAVQQSSPVAPGRSVTTFTVTESFKGATAGATVRVLHSSGSSASCGVKFSPGETYTLATHRTDSDPGLTTSLCSTWMFLPQVRISAELIQRMRALVGEK